MNKNIFILEGKRLKKSIPVLFAGAITLFITISVIAFCGIYYFSAKSDTSLIKIGLISISEKDQAYALTIADSYRASNQYFDFIVYDSQEETLSALYNLTLTAVICMPRDAVASILNGDNYHVSIYFRSMNNTADFLLYEFSKAGASILSSAQADIYAISDIYLRNGLTQYLDQVFSEVNMKNMQYALVSDTLFKTISLSPTGSSVFHFYSTAAYITILSLMGLLFAQFLSPYPHDFVLLFSRFGISLKKIYCVRFFYLFICNFILSAFLGVFLFCLIPSASGFAILAPSSCFLYFFLALCNSILFLVLSIFVKHPGSYLLLLFICVFFMAITAGFLIPPAFLGGFLRRLLPFNPYHILQQTLYGLFI